jgi:hypothetical protein
MELDGARVAWFLVSHACLLGAAACLWRPLGADLAALAILGALGSLGGTIQENLALGQRRPPSARIPSDRGEERRLWGSGPGSRSGPAFSCSRTGRAGGPLRPGSPRQSSAWPCP